MKARTIALLCSGCLIFIGMNAVTPTLGAFNSAGINTTQNATKTATVDAALSLPTGQVCNSNGADVTTCPGLVYPLAPAPRDALPDLYLNVVNTSTPGGTHTFQHQMRVNSCAPMAFNDKLNGKQLLSRFRVTRQVPGPWPSSNAARFDGTQQFASSMNTITPTDLNNLSYTLGAWIKATPTGNGGPIIGLSSSPSTVNPTSSPMMPTLGLGFGGRPRMDLRDSLGNSSPVIAPGSVKDGTWHHVMVTVPAGNGTNIRLYVDGADVGGGTKPSMPGSSVNSYWRIGGGDMSWVAGGAMSNYFNGDVAGVVVIPRVMSPAEVATLYSSATPQAYLPTNAGGGSVWMLNDPPTTTFTGSVPYVDSGDPCQMVDFSVLDGGPNERLINDQPLRSSVNAGWGPIRGAPAVGQSEQDRVMIYRTWWRAYDEDNAGLDLAVPVSYRLLTGNWSRTFTWPGNVFLG